METQTLWWKKHCTICCCCCLLFGMKIKVVGYLIAAHSEWVVNGGQFERKNKTTNSKKIKICNKLCALKTNKTCRSFIFVNYNFSKFLIKSNHLGQMVIVNFMFSVAKSVFVKEFIKEVTFIRLNLSLLSKIYLPKVVFTDLVNF